MFGAYRVQVLSAGRQARGNPLQPSKAITVINFTQVRVGSFGKGLTNEMVVSRTISLIQVECELGMHGYSIF